MDKFERIHTTLVLAPEVVQLMWEAWSHTLPKLAPNVIANFMYPAFHSWLLDKGYSLQEGIK